MAASLKQISAGNFRQPRTILQRIAGEDQAAVADCVNAYGDLIWNSVRKSVGSGALAETIVQEIFADIWKFARRCDAAGISETDFIALMIRQRLRSNQIH